jgi:hypothetical protein
LAGYRVLGSSVPISYVIGKELSVALMLVQIFTFQAGNAYVVDGAGHPYAVLLSLNTMIRLRHFAMDQPHVTAAVPTLPEDFVFPLPK